MTQRAQSAILPAHIEETVEAIARLHADHHERATPFQRFTEDLTARVGQSTTIAWLTVAVIAWAVINLALLALGREPLDRPPFAWLQGVVSLAALYATILILSTQRRDDELGSHRAQMTLELAILSEQKTAKIIQLLEELRRDHPSIHDRLDGQASAMSTPADPKTVHEALKESHNDMIYNKQ